MTVLCFASLKRPDDAGVEIDLAPRLQELRKRWFAAGTVDEREVVKAQLPEVLKPWQAKVGAQQKAMVAKIAAAGTDPAALPSGKQLEDAIGASKRLGQRLEALKAKSGGPLKKWQRVQVDRLVAEASKLLGETGETPADACCLLHRRCIERPQRGPCLGGRSGWAGRESLLG